MIRTLFIALVLVAACGKENSYPGVYATAANPVVLCPSGAPKGSWYCDQTTLEAMISPNSDGHYTAYSNGSYAFGTVGISCNIVISTITVIDGSKTCHIDTN